MEYSIITPENDFYMVIKFHVPVTRQLAFKSAIEAKEIATKIHGDKFIGVLVDSRGYPNIDSNFDNFEFAAVDVQRPQVNSDGPVAVIVSPNDDSHYSVEMAMQYMGIDFKVFKEEKTALIWLKEMVRAKRPERE